MAIRAPDGANNAAMLEANSQFSFLNELWPNVLQNTCEQMFEKKFGSRSKECHSFRASCGQYK